jgi:hypothetical protein
MENEFVPYELAVKLKQLGFDEPCNTCYDKLGMTASYGKNVFDYKNYNTGGYVVSRPTYSQAFRWFREKNQLDTSINTVYSKYNDTLSKKYSGVIDDKSVFTNIGFYDTYEEAELACLDKLIEIVENKQQEQ